jgi:hypothetical protein
METMDAKTRNELIEKEIAIATKRNIEFTESGMRTFSNVNSAVKYFRSIKQPRSIKSIVWLWQQSFEVNAANVSVLVFDYKTDPESFKKRVETIVKSPTQRKTFEKMFKIWVEKTQGIQRLPVNDVNRIIEETKTLN